MNKQHGTLTEKVKVRSRGGFVLATFPKGHPVIVKATENHVWVEPVDVIGNGIGDYAFTVAEVKYEPRSATHLERSYEALCKAKDEMEVMAHAQRKAQA